MRTPTIILATAATLSACSTFTPTPVAQASEALRPGAYRLDPDHAALTFTVSHFGVSDYLGRFNVTDASLDFDPENPEAATLDFEVDVTSLDVANETFAEELVANWLQAEEHPKARFISTGITQTGENTGTVTGSLTIAGKTNPATFDVTFLSGARNPLTRRYTVGFEATGAIKRSDFGIDNLLMVAGEKWDFDTVRLQFNGEFQRQGAVEEE